MNRTLWLLLPIALILMPLGVASGCSSSDPDAGVDAEPDGNPGGDTAGDQGKPTDDGMPDDGVVCDERTPCTTGAECCDGFCSNLQYDPANCNRCGNACPPETPYCMGGACILAPCDTVCQGGATCCGPECCEPGQVCCTVNRGGPTGGPGCYWQHCPPGCPLCRQ